MNGNSNVSLKYCHPAGDALFTINEGWNRSYLQSETACSCTYKEGFVVATGDLEKDRERKRIPCSDYQESLC